MTPAETFRLVPFPGTMSKPGFGISGSVSRTAGLLAIRFDVAGRIDEIEFAEPAKTPERRDRLWETTCFELFLAMPGSDAYREFNLSPAGHWNAYLFDRYREGMRPDTKVSELPFSTKHAGDRFSLSLDVGVSGVIPDSSDISAGITAVIRTRDGQTRYWALAHTGSEPDFHRRDSFTLRLPGRGGA